MKHTHHHQRVWIVSAVSIVTRRDTIYQVNHIGVFERYQFPTFPCYPNFIVVLIIAGRIKLSVAVVVFPELKQNSTFICVWLAINETIEIYISSHIA